MHNQCFSQSTPSNYYTPKPRSPTLQRCSSKCSVSTVTKAYNLEEYLKIYEELLTQNFHLKNIMFHQKNNLMPHQNHPNKQNLDNNTTHLPLNKPKYLNQASFQQQTPSNKLTRHQSSKCLNSTQCNQSSHQQKSQGSNFNYPNNYYQQNDMGMWSIKHRNKYLEQKLHNLEDQYSRQHKAISKVMNSQKWQNRFDCKQSTCYQDKYIKLLRVKSPVLLD